MISDTLSALIKQSSKIEEEIADLEEIISQRKADLARIMEEDIPSVLHENGLLSAPLADGRTITIDQMVSVTQVDKPAFYEWLAENNYEAVIKTDISFGKGADTEEVEIALQSIGAEYEKTQSVHPMTLKKVMKDHLAEGGLLPPDTVAKVNVFERARIKEAK